MKKATLLFIWLTLVLQPVQAQDPSFFIIGEDVLSGVDIYDLHQDKNGIIWIASNKGVYQYDGIEFTQITVPEAKGSSFFNFLELDNGIIFNNLSGQFFISDGERTTLYFQVPDTLMSNIIDVTLDSNNDLIVTSNSIYKVHEGKISEIIYRRRAGYLISPLILPDGRIFIQDILDGMTEIVNGEIKTHLFHQKLKNDNVIKYFNAQLLFFTPHYIQLFTTQHGELNNVFSRHEESGRVFIINNQLWIAYNSSGVEILDSNFQTISGKQRYFKDHFISAYLKDKEGNIWLGTFGDGLLFIPEMETKTINNINSDTKIRRVTANENGDVFFGSLKGKIFKLDTAGHTSILLSDNPKNIEFLEAIPKTDLLLFDAKLLVEFNTKTQERFEYELGALKDIEPIDDSIYIIATNVGMLLYNPYHKKSPFTTRPTPHPSFHYIGHYNERLYCAGYDQMVQTVYAGSSGGLKLNKIGVAPTAFLLNDKIVLALDILYHKGKIYVGTQKNGILIFENDKLIAQWDDKSGFLTRYFSKLYIYNNLLYAASDKGILVCNFDGEIQHVINQSSGLATNMITDFEIVRDQLYVTHQKGVQRINLQTLSPVSFIPEIEITEVLVNDIAPTSASTTFNHLQHKFSFSLRSPTYKYRDEITYAYRLLPIESNWNTNPLEYNTIEYKSLSPGDYTFEVKALFRDINSETRRYIFTITTPYWQQWWFFLLLGVLIVAITVCIYYYRVQKQLKTAHALQELNASKLTAIQSQMNPHFIFNALNSIQDLVLKGDIDNSYSYITTFSNLVRKTLKYSDKDFIAFEQEVELLHLYLAIEKLRFKTEFEYDLRTNTISDILIPPMLIQPFVENAIVHGLFHKTSDRRLTIDFQLHDDLVCVIEDNGIGREKAIEIQKRKTGQESFSTTAIRKRFDILQEVFGSSLGVEYIDLHEGEQSVGTKVILHIPVKKRF